ncbi:hypothetical protein AAH991_15250 [Microbispora sp. ZYX-F-249]|uniref:Uncharacterized protein n=1 Tax=Microbispora maris TaxID=3144104 RepID=A0ABV0AME2_9ACTN
MARMIRHLDEELYVQYGGLCVYGGTDCPEFRDGESEALHYTATLRLEAWDAEPPAPGSSWRPVDQHTFTAVTGVIQMGVMDDSGRDFLIGPPFFEYGLTAHVNVPDVTRWLFRFWPIRDVFDPLVHMNPRAPIGSAPPQEPCRVPVPVTTAGQWAAMRPEMYRLPGSGTHLMAMLLPGLVDGDPVSSGLNPDDVGTFRIPHEEHDLRDKGTGGTYRMWRWERETPDGDPEDGNLLIGRIVHLRDAHGRRVLASGIVTLLGRDGRCWLVRDAEPHEAARVVCSEATWPD